MPLLFQGEPKMETTNPLQRALDKVGIEYQPTEFPNSGLHCSLVLEKEQIQPLARALAGGGFFIETVTAVDKIKDKVFECIYLFNHYEESLRLLIRISLPRSRAVQPSIGKIFPGAVWHERETTEMFGIRFDGCPDNRNLLLPEDADFHPLCKDFSGVS